MKSLQQSPVLGIEISKNTTSVSLSSDPNKLSIESAFGNEVLGETQCHICNPCVCFHGSEITFQQILTN